MVLGVRTPGRVGRRRSLATKGAGHRDRRSSCVSGRSMPAMPAPPPRPPRRSGPPGRTTAPAGQIRGAQAAVRPSPPGDGRPTAAPDGRRASRWRCTSRRRCTALDAQGRADGRPDEPPESRGGRARAVARPDRDDSRPSRTGRPSGGRRGTDRTPARRARHAAGVAPRAGRNRAPRPSGGPPRFAVRRRSAGATRPGDRAGPDRGTHARDVDRRGIGARRSGRRDPARHRRWSLANAGRHRPGSIRRRGRDHRGRPGAVRPSCSSGSRRPRRRSIVSGSTRPIGSSRR